jgi:4-diphosphocytidyl-2-C-methyl-D-erythritol kinase
MPERFADSREAAAFFKACRNDLEPPAVALTPTIGAVLRALQARPESLLVRVSGSGATCFALCADADAARRLAADLEGEHPAWWVRACRLA